MLLNGCLEAPKLLLGLCPSSINLQRLQSCLLEVDRVFHYHNTLKMLFNGLSNNVRCVEHILRLI